MFAFLHRNDGRMLFRGIHGAGITIVSDLAFIPTEEFGSIGLTNGTSYSWKLSFRAIQQKIRTTNTNDENVVNNNNGNIVNNNNGNIGNIGNNNNGNVGNNNNGNVANNADNNDNANEQEERYPKPTRKQIRQFMKKGAASLFNPISLNGVLVDTSGKMFKHFRNNSTNLQFLPCKQYIAPNQPIESKAYIYGCSEIGKVVITQFSDVGMIRISNVVNARSGSQPGGYWRCDIEHPPMVLVYNPTDAQKREEIWKLMKFFSHDHGGYVNWWVYFGLQRAPIAMNRLLKWDNPPDFTQPIPTNGPRIDLNVHEEPPAIN